MSLMGMMKRVPPDTAELVVSLLSSVFGLIAAKNDEEKEEAAMEAAEATKRYLDRKKFGGGE